LPFLSRAGIFNRTSRTRPHLPGKDLTVNPLKLLAPLCLLTACAGLAAAENWPTWRGPERDGICHETGLPTRWGPKQNIAWELPMPGQAGSTPIVWGDRIFLTSAEGKDLILLCIGTDGKEKWKRKLGTSTRGLIRKGEANEASASPSTDGKHVFTFVGSGDLACHDFDGNPVWHFNAQQRYGRFDILHGMHPTPLLYGDRIYLALLHSGGHWVIALDKATGEEKWKVARPTDADGESKEAYSSPCLWTDGKQAYVVVLGADYTTAHRLSDGGEIWRLTGLNPSSSYDKAFRIIASPVATPELIVVPTCRNRAVVGVRPDATGRIESGSPMEQWRKAVGSPDVPSPLVADGLVYLCRENGVLICLDAKTGQQKYEATLHRAIYRASPVAADGKIYITARDGTFSVVKAGPKFELLATNQLPDDFAASPAISGGRVYLRGYRALYALQQKSE
jgi:outer membrane protein assembly factor BamB